MAITTRGTWDVGSKVDDGIAVVVRASKGCKITWIIILSGYKKGNLLILSIYFSGRKIQIYPQFD